MVDLVRIIRRIFRVNSSSCIYPSNQIDESEIKREVRTVSTSIKVLIPQTPTKADAPTRNVAIPKAPAPYNALNPSSSGSGGAVGRRGYEVGGTIYLPAGVLVDIYAGPMKGVPPRRRGGGYRVEVSAGGEEEGIGVNLPPRVALLFGGMRLRSVLARCLRK